MSRTITDLRGYTVREPEQASTKSKLLAATAVILGVVAIGAYAYTSQSILPSAPAQKNAFVNEPIPLTPPAQPAMTQPDVAVSAPQTTPAVQATPAPEINAPAPQTSAKPKSSAHIAHVKPHTPATQPESAPAVSPPDTVQVPATPSPTVTPSVTAPGTDTTTPYTAAPSTTAPQTTPDNATNNNVPNEQPQTPQ